MDEGAVKFARGKYKNIDLIVSIFTMQIIWASDSFAKKVEYSQGELVGLSIRKLIDLGPESLSYILANLFEKGGKDTQIIKTKTGKKFKATANIYSFAYEKEPHLVASDAKPEEYKKGEPRS